MRQWLRGELAGHRVLELACGTGYWTALIAPVADAVLATDASAEVLEIARQKPYPSGRVRFAVADAYEPPAVPGEFSATFAGFFWSHVPRTRTAAFLSALYGRLGPGARVVLLDNRYVAGSSTPISRRDEDGNTYQRRRLADGSEYEVLKNFPTAAELKSMPGVVEFEYYWGASYETVTR